MYKYQAALIRVHDGDTLFLTVDLGCDVSIEMDVRLAHLNAPELPTPAGKAALAFVLQWFTDHPGQIVIDTLKDKREKYGRYLGIITVAGLSLNDALISSGNAVAYEGGAPITASRASAP